MLTTYIYVCRLERIGALAAFSDIAVATPMLRRSMSQTDTAPHPTLWHALRRGLTGKCPACGDAPLFGRFLKPVPCCPACGRDWTVQRSDDFPAYLVVLVLGHLLIPLVVEVNLWFDISTGLQMLLWPVIAVVAALMMIQPAKGFVIALIWAR